MVYNLLGISWVIIGSVKGEMLAWEGLRSSNKCHILIPLTILWIIWKERSSRIFEGKETDFGTIKDRWLYFFGSIVLSHNLDSLEDFESIVDIFIDM